jgi:hypothetical protein
VIFSSVAAAAAALLFNCITAAGAAEKELIARGEVMIDLV